MKRLLAPAAAVVTVLMIGNVAAIAANKPKTNYTPQECAKLDREYAALEKQERQLKSKKQLSSSESAQLRQIRSRMGDIDNINNVYCS